jgi:hypothetical protein
LYKCKKISLSFCPPLFSPPFGFIQKWGKKILKIKKIKEGLDENWKVMTEFFSDSYI